MFGKLQGAGRWLGLGLVEGVTSNVHGSAVEWVPNLCHSQLVLKLSWAATIATIATVFVVENFYQCKDDLFCNSYCNASSVRLYCKLVF